jgi:hypothetical protein
MDHPVAARTISRIKVDVHPDADRPSRVTLEWVDEANATQREAYAGIFAERFKTDLEACSVQGEEHRKSYLIGRIRELQRRAG